MNDALPEAGLGPLLDARSLRTALGGFATGVTVVTCRDSSGSPIGLTVNSFSALSLDPPMVLWSLRLASPNLAAFDAARYFAVNVLAEAQVDLSRRFASLVSAKFDEGLWGRGIAGVPVLAGCTATLECKLVSHQAAGDHRLYFGHVVAATSQPVPPLIYYSGRYHLLGEIL
jgi:3-hydroxy-9,10-secoandrosta-1,3,5(10)-triene-9,17-dione monooxygenase reductase component